MRARVQHKHDTAANWTANNTVLLQGEWGYVTDAADDTVRVKIGDGTTPWNSLSFFVGGGGGGGGVSLGESSGTAYRGDRGKTAYDHSQVTSGNPHGTSDANLTTTDVTTNNVSRTKHGFAPKAPSGSGTTKFLREDSTWAEPPGGGGGGGSIIETEVADATELDTLITTAGANPANLYNTVVTGDVAVTAAKVVPDNVRMKPLNGGKFVRSGSGTLKFEGDPFKGAGGIDALNPATVFDGFSSKFFYVAAGGTNGGTTVNFSHHLGGTLPQTPASGDTGKFLVLPEYDYVSQMTYVSASQVTVADALPATFANKDAYITDLRFEGGAPAAVSTRLINSTSLTTQLRVLAAAFMGSQVEFHCHPANITDSVKLADYQSLYFHPGEYPNTVSTWGGSYAPPFILGSHSRFHSAKGAIIYDSSVSENAYLVAAFGKTDVVVEKNTFKSTNGSGSDISNAVFLAACTHSHIRLNKFDGMQSYNAGILDWNGVPSEDCSIDGNLFKGTPTQICHISSCRRGYVINNRFELDDINNSFPYGPIDIEPNVGTDVCEDIVIDRNHIYARNGNNQMYGILVQGVQGGTEGCQRLTVTNNTVIARDIMNPDTQTGSQFGAIIHGFEDVTFRGNIFAGCTQIQINKCRYGEVAYNKFIYCGSADGFLSMTGIGDFKVHDNWHLKTPTVTDLAQHGSITERVLQMPVTVSGVDVTGANGYASYPYMIGMRAMINRTLYTIVDRTPHADGDPVPIELNTSAGTWSNINFAPSAVSVADDEIDLGAPHGLVTGAAVEVTSTSAFPGNLPTQDFGSRTKPMYVIEGSTANKLKFAEAIVLAEAGTAINITNQGTGTHTLRLLMSLYGDNTKYANNFAEDGIFIETPLPSKVISDATREIKTSFPVTINGTMNDWAPATKAHQYRVTADGAARTITGLNQHPTDPELGRLYGGFMDGERREIYNAGTNDVVLAHESGSSTAKYRFWCHGAAAITLAAKEKASLEYNSTLQRWVVYRVGDVASGGGSGTITSGTTNAIPKYTAGTTVDDSLISDDGTTLTYSGTGGIATTSSTQGAVGVSDTDLSHTVWFEAGSNTTADRTVTFTTGDANRTIDLTDDNAAGVGFRGIPQSSQSANYTTVLSDAGKHILHPSTDANTRTFTIPANASVAYPIGTALTFVNETSQVVTIAITTDTMTLAGTTTTGSRSLAQNGIATAVKVGTTKWLVNGTGLT